MSSPRQEPDRSARIGWGVLLALLTAKAIVMASIGLRPSTASLPGFLWQDIATGGAVALGVVASRSRGLAWAVAIATVCYVALSVPITIVLGSPLTWTMMRAARGPLSDSIRHHLTAGNFTAIGGVSLAFGVGLWLAGRATRHARLAVGVVLAATMAIGAWPRADLETAGLDRNALTALLPRFGAVGAAAAGDPDRASPFPGNVSATDVTAYRASGRGMNVLLVVLESAAAQYLRPYGAADDPMPALTAFSEHALIYDRAYAAYPESVKGLYATLCGRMPVIGLPAEAHASLPCAAIARSFSSAGYRTALFHSGRFGYLGMAELLRDKGFDQLEDAGAIGGHVQSSFGVDEESTVDRLLAWVDDGDGTRPFLAVYLPIAGHHPYATTRAGPFAAASDFGRYKNALHEADDAVDRLLQGLRHRGIDRRTLVMIVGDHGEAFGQHPGNAGHSLFVYDENVHVPWLIAIPGVSDRGRHVETVTSLVDVPSTLRDLTGLPVERADQGHGLTHTQAPIALFFADYSLSLSGLRDGCWTYIYDSAADRSRLFDDCHDPSQTVDHAGDEPLRVAAYRGRVRTALLGQSDKMFGQR